MDGDPATAWHAEAGEIGTFYAAGNHVEAVRIGGEVDEVAVRSLRPITMDGPRVSEWVRRDVRSTGVVEMGHPDWAVEIRVLQSARIHTVSLLSKTPGRVDRVEWLEYLGSATGSGDLMSAKAVRFGRIDLVNCALESPGNMPDGAFSGRIDCSEHGFQVDATNPYRGHVSGSFVVEEVGSCLRMVDGWPMASCW
ncbi:MAG: hypothetical protein KTR31_01740 [Myxococcales bacterium]|nr:hypothetical protein [Myxococcales bacterium]